MNLVAITSLLVGACGQSMPANSAEAQFAEMGIRQ